MAKDYSTWSKPDLIRELDKVGKRKKYGIVWEDKVEEVAKLCKEKLPILEEVKQKEIVNIKDSSSPTNILVEGDNYHSLSVLCYTHSRAIDIIYIDPPYNTGSAKEWKYNDKFIDREDSYRHSKWLSFMEKRLKLAKNLLKFDGLVYISVGSDELAQLKILCDEIYGEINFIEIVTRVSKTASNQGTHFSPSVDYILCYSKNLEKLGTFKDIITEKYIKLFNKQDKRGMYREISFFQSGLVGERPSRYYVECPDGSKAIPPIKKFWRWSEETYIKNLDEDRVIFKKAKNSPLLDGSGVKSLWNIYTKTYLDDRKEKGNRPRNFLTEYINRQGADLLSAMKIDFNYSKPVGLIKYLIQITNKQKDVTILDFFAGSGTTGHAVLELNKEDSGNRKFILCTNNEDNNGDGAKIAEDICYPRISRVIKGYNGVNGLGGNLKYFKTDFVDAEQTDENKRKLVDKSTDMLCLKEDCFEKLEEGHEFKIFTNGQNKLLGIIYDDKGIVPFKETAKKINKRLVVYVFSLDESAREEEFEDIRNLVNLKPIPAVILNVYKRIFK